MPDSLLAPDFVQGYVEYTDNEDRTQPHTRIVIPVTFGFDPIPTTAVVDTGAPWCILKPNLAEHIGIDYKATADQYKSMHIRGAVYRGWVCSGIPVTLDATKGEGLTVDATVFIPDLELGQEWPLPNFIGLSGFLERIRFAVDPSTYRFYFGAIE